VTQQHVRQVPVTADREVLDRLRRAADEMSTGEVTAYARSEGVTPPSDDAAWELLPQFEADGTDGPLMWVLVTELADD
jgi:hypothetical protein